MSVSIDYYFNSSHQLGKLARLINDHLGCSLAPYEGNPNDLFCRFCGLEFDLLDDHGLVRDGELNFEDFEFALGTRTAAGAGHLRPIQIEVTAIAAFILAEKLSIHEGILCFDAQQLLARYQMRGEEWFDEVSGRAVRFPEHFVDLRSRIADLRADWGF